MKVGFLGPIGSFTYTASLTAFPQADLVPVESITDLIKAYEKGLVDYAVVPVENSIEGSVHQTVDYLFHQGNITAVAELVLPIKQQLMATGLDKEIERVYSHPQALAQSKKFLDENYPHAALEITESTAYAARYVAENPDENIAAIAPSLSAETYGLDIIANDIQEIEDNNTRFWVLGTKIPNLTLTSKEKKVSIALTLANNQPGALYQALKIFAERKLDLTKIESRPLKTVLGEYFFLLDFLDNGSDLSSIFSDIEANGTTVKLFGTYEVYYL